jgi:hypothetical protein
MGSQHGVLVALLVASRMETACHLRRPKKWYRYPQTEAKRAGETRSSGPQSDRNASILGERTVKAEWFNQRSAGMPRRTFFEQHF